MQVINIRKYTHALVTIWDDSFYCNRFVYINSINYYDAHQPKINILSLLLHVITIIRNTKAFNSAQ
jgi:hypothetical protein